MLHRYFTSINFWKNEFHTAGNHPYCWNFYKNVLILLSGEIIKTICVNKREFWSRVQCLSRKYPAMYYEKQKYLLKKTQDTRNIVHKTWSLSSLQSRHLGTSHSAPSISFTVQNTLPNPLLESPSAALLCFPESHR